MIVAETKKYFAKIGFQHGVETLNNAVACVEMLLKDYGGDIQLILKELYPEEEFNDSKRKEEAKKESQKVSKKSR